MNHGCHLILTENGSKILAPWKLNAPTKGATRRRRRWPCPSPPPPSTRWQCLSSFASCSMFNSSSLSPTLSTSFLFHVCRLHHLIILISNVNRTLPSSTISCMPIVYIAIITTFITTIILLIVNFSSLELAPSRWTMPAAKQIQMGTSGTFNILNMMIIADQESIKTKCWKCHSL